MNKKDLAKEVFNTLSKIYSTKKVPLNHSNPLELLVATILSAQCTDDRVNIVTKTLFKKYKTSKDYANANKEELETIIFSTGFYKSKASNIIKTAKKLIKDHNSKIPKSIKELTTLNGVGRKTANVVLGHAYNIQEGIVVDTHVGRLAVRLNLTKETNSKNALKIEKDLMKVFENKVWLKIHLLLIFHGRAICTARNPNCKECQLLKICKRNGLKPLNNTKTYKNSSNLKNNYES